MKVAVVGCGGHSRRHGEALRRIADSGFPVELAAVCDLDRAKASQYREDYGFSTHFVDMHEMVASVAPDALVLETPVGLNAAVALDMLEYRIPLLVEKPPGRDAAEAQSLADAAAASEVPIMVSFDRRFNPAVMAAREWIRTHRSFPPYLEARMLRFNRREERFLQETGIHLIDLVHYLVGKTREVSRQGVEFNRTGGKPFVGHLRSEEGCSSQIAILPAVGVEEESIVMHGDDYSIFIDRHRGSLKVYRKGDPVVNRGAPPEGATIATHVNEMRSFLDCIASHEPFPVTMEEGLAAIRVTSEMALAAT